MLVHGFSLDTRMWDDQWATFAERYRVVRLDLRGFGRSEAEPATYSDLDDLLAVLDAFEIPRTHVLGLSMGAAMVIDFTLAHPERVNGLVAVAGRPSGSGGFRADAREILNQAAQGHVAEAARAWLASELFAPAMRQPGVAPRVRQMITEFGWWRALHPGLVRPLEPPAAVRLQEITAPTLVLVGEHDRSDVRAACQALAAGIGGARLVVIPGVGHLSNMEDPAAFNAAVLEFLATA